MPSAILVVNGAGSIVYASDHVSRHLGWSQVELVGSKALALFRVQDHGKLQAIFSAQNGAENVFSSPMTARTGISNKNQQLVSISLSAAAFEWQGARHTLLSIQFSELERLELRLAKEQAFEFKNASDNKSRFLSHMSHEIRTPLNSILGMIDLLATTSLNPKQRDYLFILKKNSRSLRALIKDVLDLSKIEAGMVETENIPFDLADMLTTVIHSHRPSARAKKVGLILESDLFCKHWNGDPQRLIQVLNNLVGNAIKFTAAGSVTVSVTSSAAMANDETSRLTITVTDTGIGMTQQQQEEIFAEYQQGAKSVSRHYGGTGLGLFITKELVRLMGGEISVRSQSGKGSTFEFSVDLIPSYSTQAFLDTAPPSNLSLLAGARVLVVEDDLTNQVLLQAWLAQAVVRTVCCSNGQDALEELSKQDRFDAVLMDVSMPVMDGLTATAHIRRPQPQDTPERQRYLASLPIIGISGHAFSEDLARCLAAGMAASLTKPLSRSTVLETLTSVIQAKDAS